MFKRFWWMFLVILLPGQLSPTERPRKSEAESAEPVDD
jgi:hypothetical protein